MPVKVMRSFLVVFLIFTLSGCNLPLSGTAAPRASEPANGGITYVTTTPTAEVVETPIGAFDPLELDCLVGTWDVDSDSLRYAGNMLLGNSGLTLINVTPHIFFRILWDEPLLGSTYTMEVWYMDVLVSGLSTAGDSEHLLELVFNGSTTAYFSAGAAAGSFDYHNDPERSTLEVSGIKMDGVPLPEGAIPLADLIQSIPVSTMYYTCESPDRITLRDKNAVEPITLRLVPNETLPAS